MKAWARLSEELAQAVAEDPQESLVSDQTNASNALDAQAQKLEDLQRNRPADTVALMDARIDHYEKKGREDRDRRNRLASQLAVLASRIDIGGGSGVDEKFENVNRVGEELTRERNELESRATCCCCCASCPRLSGRQRSVIARRWSAA